ncbi:MAG: sulfate transporter CysZ [Gammaproteobacteria bacterium]|nr:MAG: sulfate transporter CysZ [Gammaproteobacteria bacterium]
MNRPNVVNCFSEALALIFKPGFRIFILAPIALNIFIFLILSYAALHYAQTAFSHFETSIPDWLVWIKWLLWPLLILIILIIYGYSFNLFTTIIAAPFLGLLAEKVEQSVTGIAPTDEPWIQLIPRTFKRELIKLIYFIPRSLGIFLLVVLLILVPGANIVGGILGGLWSCWCLALQFCDYPADNHRISFEQVRTQLGQQKINTFAFGSIVLCGSMVPIINIFITPLSVAAGTIFWLEQNKK